MVKKSLPTGSGKDGLFSPVLRLLRIMGHLAVIAAGLKPGKTKTPPAKSAAGFLKGSVAGEVIRQR